MLIVHLIFAAAGLLFAGIGIPLWLEKVGPNGLYGFRTAATLSNRRVWFAVNKVLGRDLVFLGLFQIAAAGVGYVLAPKKAPDYVQGQMATIQMGILAAGFVVVVIHCALALRRISRETEKDQP